MNELLDLAVKFDNGELDDAEAVRFAALLVHTGMVHSVGKFGRFINDMIEAEREAEIRAVMDELAADPFEVVGIIVAERETAR